MQGKSTNNTADAAVPITRTTATDAGAQHMAILAAHRLAALQLAFTRGYEAHQQPQLASLAICNSCREAVPIKLTFTDDMPLSLQALFFPSSATDQSNTTNATSCGVTASNPSAYDNPTAAGSARYATGLIPPSTISIEPAGIPSWGSPSLEEHAHAFSVNMRESPKERDNILACWTNGGNGGGDHDCGDCFTDGLSDGSALSATECFACTPKVSPDPVSPKHPVSVSGKVSRCSRLAQYGRVSHVVWSGLTLFLEHIVMWPEGVDILSFPNEFKEPIEGVNWPSGLRELVLKEGFDQSIVNIDWPKCLERISLGLSFNHPIEDARWPGALRYLNLGRSFNQPIERVVWPSGLREIRWGDAFDHPVEQVNKMTIGGPRWAVSTCGLITNCSRQLGS